MAFLKLNDSLVPNLSYTQLDTIPIEPENQIRYAKVKLKDVYWEDLLEISKEFTASKNLMSVF